MTELASSLYIFLAVGTGGNALQGMALTFQDWLTIFTSVGIPLGGAIAWITNFYKAQVEAQDKQYKVQVENLKEAYIINEGRLNATLQRRESEIQELFDKTKRLENIYSTEFIEPEGAKTFLDLLIINLTHLQKQLKDENSSLEIEKIKSFCTDSISSLTSNSLSEIEAANWLFTNKSNLVKGAINHILRKFDTILDERNDKNSQKNRTNLCRDIENFIDFLEVSLRLGTLLTEDTPKLTSNNSAHVKEALKFIKDIRAPGELPSNASIVVQSFIGKLIRFIA